MRWAIPQILFAVAIITAIFNISKIATQIDENAAQIDLMRDNQAIRAQVGDQIMREIVDIKADIRARCK